MLFDFCVVGFHFVSETCIIGFHFVSETCKTLHHTRFKCVQFLVKSLFEFILSPIQGTPTEYEESKAESRKWPPQLKAFEQTFHESDSPYYYLMSERVEQQNRCAITTIPDLHEFFNLHRSEF